MMPFMREVTNDPKLVAACGLYCGACKSYLKERCSGCAENERAGWCKVRSCCREMGHSTCASCTEFERVDDCRKYNNIMARLFGLLFNSDRKLCIERIKESGLEAFASEMAEKRLQTFRRR
jgi:hypothetical protein